MVHIFDGVVKVDPKLLNQLLVEVDYFYSLIESNLPEDSLASKFALEDLSSIRSYFEDYLIPKGNGKSK